MLQILIKKDRQLNKLRSTKVSRVKGPCYFHSVTCIIKEYDPDLNTKTKKRFMKMQDGRIFVFLPRIPSIIMKLPAGKEGDHFFL